MKFKDICFFLEEMLLLIFAIVVVCFMLYKLGYITITITVPFAILFISVVFLVLCISLFSRIIHLGFFSMLDFVFQNTCKRKYVFVEKQEIYSSIFVFRKKIDGTDERQYYLMHFQNNGINHTFITTHDIDLESGKLYEITIGALFGVLTNWTEAKE